SRTAPLVPRLAASRSKVRGDPGRCSLVRRRPGRRSGRSGEDAARTAARHPPLCKAPVPSHDGHRGRGSGSADRAVPPPRHRARPSGIAGWIFRVVTRLCMLPVLVMIRGAEELTERHEAQYFAQVPKDELRIDVVRALESLPDMYRVVILLRDMEQLTIGEVADRLRIT